MISKTITKCRLCDATDLHTILELGDQPPANSLRKKVSGTLENVPLTDKKMSKSINTLINAYYDLGIVYNEKLEAPMNAINEGFVG